MGRYIFDLESDGLLDEMTTIHCLVLKDIDTGEIHPGPVDANLKRLASADLIVGHNVISFDIPAIQKLHPEWKPQGLVRDTMVCAQLAYPRDVLMDTDSRLADRGRFPKKLLARQSLEAWGHRLGNYKGDFKGPWDSWSETMQEYCEQDVEVTFTLWQRLLKTFAEWDIDPLAPNPEPRKSCVQLEHAVARIIARQERHGFAFDVDAASVLYGRLAARRTELEQALTLAFPPKEIRTVVVPRANNSKYGYTKGVPVEKVRIVPFNPGSRKQVAARLVELGWTPQEFTSDGTPKVDDEILESLPYPQSKLLAEFFMIEKRMGQIGTAERRGSRPSVGPYPRACRDQRCGYRANDAPEPKHRSGSRCGSALRQGVPLLLHGQPR